MLAKVDYIKNIFKINTDNPYMITDIADELNKINSFNDFRCWLKPNLNHIDVQYMNPYNKFIFLVRLYLRKRLEFTNRDKINKGRKDALILAKKVKSVSLQVIDEGKTYMDFKNENGEDYFSSADELQLKKVGGLSSAARMQKSISGTDALYDRLEELAYDVAVTHVLEYKPEEKTNDSVKKLIKEIVKKI